MSLGKFGRRTVVDSYRFNLTHAYSARVAPAQLEGFEDRFQWTLFKWGKEIASGLVDSEQEGRDLVRSRAEALAEHDGDGPSTKRERGRLESRIQTNRAFLAALLCQAYREPAIDVLNDYYVTTHLEQYFDLWQRMKGDVHTALPRDEESFRKDTVEILIKLKMMEQAPISSHQTEWRLTSRGVHLLKRVFPEFFASAEVQGELIRKLAEDKRRALGEPTRQNGDHHAKMAPEVEDEEQETVDDGEDLPELN